MAKHRRRSQFTARKTAAASAVLVGSAAALATPAQAAEVVVPGTNVSVDVPGIENVPNASQFIPSLSGQGIVDNFNAVVNPSSNNSTGQAIVDAARSKIGSPYVWGATGPNAFDCSGLTSWAYAQVGKAIPRTSYAQAAQGTPVPLDQLQPGDIVSFYSGASHVGIYAGNGNVIHAVTEGTPLSEAPMSSMPIYNAVRF
ncbi:C40 family peptidase [Corynebacterium vitaeruminis]|uniref:NlpC/P60 domain-containing protein n=1 Tax=Corynebacterium vitaeruminis DSM 20294 TaxID=1224164 RepID=W5Y1V6_9CORY|nr:C40 family peptidase [Corynebacterium vitaeruminis]AHI23202.1 hypothetical protein B843_09085 [Corynebacterium vitaeruminis DSM 20294]